VLNDVPTGMIEAFANYQDYYENAQGARGALESPGVASRPEMPAPAEVGVTKNGFNRN